jgi:peptidase, S41 family
MKKKITWINTLIFSALLLAAVFFVPQLAALPNSDSSANDDRTNLKFLEAVYQLVRESYVDEVDPAVLYKGAMEGMLNSLKDPYTVYVYRDSQIGHDLGDTTNGVFYGIGVTISKPLISTPERPAYVEISSPIEGSPGWRAGLQSGDYITAIDGSPTENITQEEVLNKLRGKEGTEVKIKILRGKSLEFELTLVRSKIEVPTVKSVKLEKDIAYIRLIEFNPNSEKRVAEALKDLQKQGCKKLIFDLRNNPGGLITSSIDISSLFLQSGTVVSTKGRAFGSNHSYNVKGYGTKIPEEMPVVILINSGSASASEIVAGALKDHKRAYLVGTKSYGKGLVQNIIDLTDKEAVKLTIARYYSPSGANIDKLGILPDMEVKKMEFTPEEEKAAVELLKTTEIAKFTRSKKTLTVSEMENFAKKLSAKYKIRERLLLRLIKVEYYRSHESPVIDYDDDEQLQAAVNLLNTKDVNALSRKTKSLFEMQEEQKKEAASAKK